jgi:hypothetical protein
MQALADSIHWLLVLHGLAPALWQIITWLSCAATKLCAGCMPRSTISYLPSSVCAVVAQFEASDRIRNHQLTLFGSDATSHAAWFVGLKANRTFACKGIRGVSCLLVNTPPKASGVLHPCAARPGPFSVTVICCYVLSPLFGQQLARWSLSTSTIFLLLPHPSVWDQTGTVEQQLHG